MEKRLWCVSAVLALLFTAMPQPVLAAARSVRCPGTRAAQVFPFDQPAVSQGGRFVAFSTAASLAADDTNDSLDVYVWSARHRWFERVSVGPDGQQGDGPAQYPAITPNARFVAFQSDAQLLPGDSDGPATDVFVYDRLRDVTDQVSQGLNAAVTKGESSRPSISANGRFVAFRSTSDNLVPEDKNETVDVFVHDRKTDTTVRVSVSSKGEEGNDRSAGRSRGGLDISANGRFVVFESAASTVVPSDDADWGDSDVFIHDLRSHETSLVSVGYDGTGAVGSDANFEGGDSLSPSVSADGRFVAFESNAVNLVENDGNNQGADGGYLTDVFVRDMAEEKTVRVSVASDGTEADGSSHFPSISGDGRLVSFESSAPNLVGDDGNGEFDVFVHDLQKSETARVSQGSGDETDPQHRFPLGSVSAALSPDGGTIAFASDASDLAVKDANGAFDVFVRNTRGGKPPVRLGSPCRSAEPKSAAVHGHSGDGPTGRSLLSLSEPLLEPLAVAIVLLLLLWATLRRLPFLRPVALSLLGTVALLAGPPSAVAHHYKPIQPGAQLHEEEVQCTLNFVFRDGRGDLFIGTAAHCIRDSGTDGVVGARMFIEGVGEFGTTVYGRYNLWSSRAQDFVLIRIDRDKHDLVDPSLRGWGGPTGVQTEFRPGMGTLYYGFGSFLRNTEPTRAKTGVLKYVKEGGPYEGWYVDDHVAMPGDSGSPGITEDGKAFGITSGLAVAFGESGVEFGPTVALILDELHFAGFDVELLTSDFPADPVALVQHCAQKPLDDSRRGDGCVRSNPGP